MVRPQSSFTRGNKKDPTILQLILASSCLQQPPSYSWKCCPATSFARVFLQLPRALPGSAVLHQPVLHLHISVFSYPELFLEVLSCSNLCCTCTCLSSAAPSSSCKCCPATSCVAPGHVFLQMPRALPGSAVLQHPVLHLDVRAFSSPELFLGVLFFSNLCCTCMCLPSAAPGSSWKCCAAPARVCLQQSVLHLDVSAWPTASGAAPGLVCLHQQVLHLDLSVYSTTTCAASGRICQHSTAACASSNISVYSSPTYRSFWTSAAWAAPRGVWSTRTCWTKRRILDTVYSPAAWNSQKTESMEVVMLLVCCSYSRKTKEVAFGRATVRIFVWLQKCQTNKFCVWYR